MVTCKQYLEYSQPRALVVGYPARYRVPGFDSVQHVFLLARAFGHAIGALRRTRRILRSDLINSASSRSEKSTSTTAPRCGERATYMWVGPKLPIVLSLTGPRVSQPNKCHVASLEHLQNAVRYPRAQAPHHPSTRWYASQSENDSLCIRLFGCLFHQYRSRVVPATGCFGDGRCFPRELLAKAASRRPRALMGLVHYPRHDDRHGEITIMSMSGADLLVHLHRDIVSASPVGRRKD